MEMPSLQRGSSWSSVGSMSSLGHMTFSLKDTHDIAGGSSQDTIYSCDSADSDMALTSPFNDKEMLAAGGIESAATWPPAPIKLPPPPPRPSRHLRPPLKPLTIDAAPASKRPWPLAPYSYNPFEDFDDPSVSLDLADSSTRADSLEIDPGLFKLECQPKEGSVAQQTIVEDEPWSARGSRFSWTPKRKAFDLSSVLSPETRQTERPVAAQAVTASSTTSRGSDTTVDGRQTKPGKRALGVGSMEARAIIGLRIRNLSFKGSDRGSVQDKENNSKSSTTMVGHKPLSPLPIAIITRDSNHAEATKQLELPAYHRGLRKQVYPPRVRYIQHSKPNSISSSPASFAGGQHPHTRCSPEEHSRMYTPRAAFDHVRTSSLR